MKTTTMRAALLIGALLTGSTTACEDSVAPAQDRVVATVQIGGAGPLVVGDTLRLSAAPRDEDGEVVLGQVITWSAETPGVVELLHPGSTVLVRALGPGTTRVIASVDDVTGSAALTVTVPPITVASVVMWNVSGGGPQQRAILEPGTALTALAAALQANGTQIGRTITWRSSDTTIAQVVGSHDGRMAVVTAVAPGTASVFAEAEGKSAAATVIVPGPTTPASRIDIVPGELLVELGAEVEPQAYAWNAVDGAWIDDPEVIWLSTDTSVVTVEGLATGGRARLRARAEGTVYITAYTGGRTATARVRVKAAPGVGSVILTPARRGVWVGETFRFEPAVIAPTGGTLADYPVRWSVEDPTIASIRADGMLEALRVGTTRVRATSGGVTRTAELEVLARPSGATRFALLPNVEPGGGPRVTVAIGVTPWPSVQVVTHDAERWLVGGSLLVDFSTMRYEQTLSADVVVVRDGVVSVVRRETVTARGLVIADLLDPSRLTLRTAVGTSQPAVFTEAGVLVVHQQIGTAPVIGWVYGM